MRIAAWVLLLPLLLFAERVRFDHIETSLLSNVTKRPVAVTLTVELEGDDVAAERVRLLDVIQTALGGLWAETLVTSAGKERLKRDIVTLASRQYGIGVEYVYLLDVKILPKARECLELLERFGLQEGAVKGSRR